MHLWLAEWEKAGEGGCGGLPSIPIVTPQLHSTRPRLDRHSWGYKDRASAHSRAVLHMHGLHGCCFLCYCIPSAAAIKIRGPINATVLTTDPTFPVSS